MFPERTNGPDRSQRPHVLEVPIVVQDPFVVQRQRHGLSFFFFRCSFKVRFLFFFEFFGL